MPPGPVGRSGMHKFLLSQTKEIGGALQLRISEQRQLRPNAGGFFSPISFLFFCSGVSHDMGRGEIVALAFEEQAIVET